MIAPSVFNDVNGDYPMVSMAADCAKRAAESSVHRNVKVIFFIWIVIVFYYWA